MRHALIEPRRKATSSVGSRSPTRLPVVRESRCEEQMAVKGGRLDFLAPHLLRSQLLRPGFVRLSLRMGAAQQMPGWARRQFTNAGVSSRDLDRVLGRITSLETWVD